MLFYYLLTVDDWRGVHSFDVIGDFESCCESRLVSSCFRCVCSVRLHFADLTEPSNHRFYRFLERTFPVRKFHWLSSSTIVNASATILHRIHFMAQCNASISCRNGFLFVEVKVQLLTSFPLYKFSPNRLADVCKLSLGFFFIDSKQRKSLGNYRIRWLQKESLVNCCSIVLKVCVFIYEFIVIIIVTISIVITGSYDARRYCTGLW